jgi:signal transduction histidine kinase
MNKIFNEVIKRKALVLWILALLFTIVSFLKLSSSGSMDREVASLEDRIHKRQQLLEEYALKALEQPDTLFLYFEDFPEDMVIYRYFNSNGIDTLQSWINQFPVSNDDINYYISGYGIGHLNSKNLTNTPLAYVTNVEQYMNLGSAWYIVKRYEKDNMKVISALLVQTDYPTENTLLKNKVNPNLSLKEHFSIVPVAYDESYVIKGKEGGILFSVLKKLPAQGKESAVELRWLAMICAISALFINLYKRRRFSNFFLLSGLLVLIWFIAKYQSSQLQTDLELFSPNLYADFGLFNSLADLLMANTLIFLFLVAIFMMRRSISRTIFKAGVRKKRVIKMVLIMIPISLVPYIHISLKSVILNSSIALELYKIDEITIYTLLVYLSYSLLFLYLLFSLQLLRPFYGFLRRNSLLKPRNLMIYILLVSLYTVLTISITGFRKESDRNRVVTTKLSSERDLNAELQLKDVGRQIEIDPILIYWINSPGWKVIVSTRIAETYLWNVLQRYNLRMTRCLDGEQIGLRDQKLYVPCTSYFDNQIINYGTPLYEGSGFYFMNYPNGNTGYLGAFKYFSPSGVTRLYLEFDSKFLKEAAGYPEELLSYTKHDNYFIPRNYSYGKYLNNRLVSYNGDYNYPVVPPADFSGGYSAFRKDGYLHFVNKFTSEDMVILSRHERNPFSYLITFSYITLFYSLIFFVVTGSRRKGSLYRLPRNSFRGKITTLILSSLVGALLFLGAGSIWFSINFFNNSNRAQMAEKLNSVQSSLSDKSRDVQQYNDQEFNNAALMESMNRLSNNTQTDINVYGSDGRLLRTTQTEIFDSFLLGTRMNPKAYFEIVHNNKKQFVNKENIAGNEYYSLYAPLYNQNGTLIAIANIPYFTKLTGMNSDSSTIIATIINIYLLLLLAAVFGGVALSNSISKPLAEISKKMELTDITQKPEHIDYTQKDELGILVGSYNKMVDDLEESAKILAQGEREQAWREMARQIAHEIKNPLTPMRLSIQHLVRLKEQGMEDWPRRFDLLANSLIEQIDILSDAASEFSSFSRFYSEELRDVELNSLIKEQIVLFSNRDNISVSFSSNCKEAIVFARRTQLTRVLVNLLSNAVQSLEKKEKGKISVTLRLSRSYYEVSVEDDGAGVPENLSNRLFKPNFTTKSGGTGLGLAICRSIIEQSQGEIFYSLSQKLGGANFTFRLPVKERELFTSGGEKSE